jgi:histidinol-phosphate aminotransferase
MKPAPKPGIMDIAPYIPGRSTAAGISRPLKLSANENPYGCSSRARAAYAATASELHLYPDANTSRLRAAIAEKYGLEPERLVFGAGSDEIFSMAAQVFLRAGDNAVQPQYGFAAWAIAVAAAGGCMKSAREPAFVVDVDAMIAAIDERTRVVFLANPANPTGTLLPFEAIKRLHGQMPTNVLLVLDGAYSECAEQIPGFSDGIEWARDKDNVLVTRTFSKAYGLASLRIGWAYGPVEVVEALNRIRLPFSVTRAGEAAAVAALADDDFLQRSVREFAVGRQRLDERLLALGLRTLPSAANFVTAFFPNAKHVSDALASRGILVRHLSNYNMPEWLRISVGMPDDVARVIDAIVDTM